MSVSLTRLLNIRHPIIQAPMVGVSTPALAAAVSNAGALGSIGLGASNAAQSLALIEATRALTTQAFNVNLFCHQPAVADLAAESAWLDFLAPVFREFKVSPPTRLKDGYSSFLEQEDTLAMLLRERPAVASFHFGLPPADWIAALRQAGVVTLACVTSPAEAHMAEYAGVDALIAQGVEAGGHRGVFDVTQDRCIGTFALVALLAASTRLPVIAAGGIMNGAGINAAMRLGAAGVQMGTAFIACPESAASLAHRAALVGERGHDTVISTAISGRPARGMRNRLFTSLASPDAPRLPAYPIAYDAAKAVVAAAGAAGNGDFAVQWAGQGAPLSRAMPAGELVERLANEMSSS